MFNTFVLKPLYFILRWGGLLGGLLLALILVLTGQWIAAILFIVAIYFCFIAFDPSDEDKEAALDLEALLGLAIAVILAFVSIPVTNYVTKHVDFAELVGMRPARTELPPTDSPAWDGVGCLPFGDTMFCPAGEEQPAADAPDVVQEPADDDNGGCVLPLLPAEGGECLPPRPATEVPSNNDTPAAQASNCDIANVVIPAVSWTKWFDAENQICSDATKVRPHFEVPVTAMEGATQLATDFDDTNVSTLVDGNPWLLYEYDIPSGYRPVFQATQGDVVTSYSFCWQREERDSDESTLETQLLMRIKPHNGGSALITFVPVKETDVPAIGNMCP